MVTLLQVQELLDDRPRKFNAEEVEYGPAPEGSVFRCAACIHLFTRRIDGFNTCEIFRDPEVDANGVRPDFRCAFWSSDSDVRPLLEEPPSTEHEETPTDEQIEF